MDSFLNLIPIIVISSIIISSFFLRNPIKGLVYFAFIICSFTPIAYFYSNQPDLINPFSFVSYTSTVILWFTASYILFPFIFENGFNIWVLILIIFILISSISVNINYNIPINIFVGFAFIGTCIGALTSLPIYFFGNKNVLFIDDYLSPDNQKCSMASNQTFKCSVYKNGELVAST